ncbi:MAG: phosphonate metabolism transcriptional regulator PhnF [Proteobacteria bacterium]|nr:phosphonate metabolism transcriptional regulator PhnF [Pseudomonadota bacterium]
MLDRHSGVALWRQIEDSLAHDIGNKLLRDRMPNETELATQFAVNRHTIRRALQALEARGLVRIEQGRGTFVQEEMIDYQLGRRTRFSHSLQKQHLAGQSQVLHVKTEAATPEICQHLGLAVESHVLHIEALDIVDERVVGVCHQYFPLPRFQGFETFYTSQPNTNLALKAFGIHQYQRKSSRISARLPESGQAQLLSQTKFQPLLCVESVYSDANSQIIEYGITHFTGDAVQIYLEAETF